MSGWQTLVLTLLGGVGAAALITGLLNLRIRKLNRGDTVLDNSSAQNLEFRGLVQRHVMGFDAPVYQILLALMAEVNYERERRGDQPRTWPKIPDPEKFPLYPGDDRKEKP